MALYQLDDKTPQVADSAWVADSAQVMGDVQLDENVSIWFNCTLRGDNDPITIGEGSNIQDGSVLHTDEGVPLTGIGAVVLNGAKIGKNCLVGAGALVTEGKEFPDGSMILGSPAKVVRQLTPEQIEGLRYSAQHYIDNANRYRKGLKKIA